MREFRGFIAWILLDWAMKTWHPSDPMRLRCAEFILALAQWQKRYDAEERQRRELQRAWKAKLRS